MSLKDEVVKTMRQSLSDNTKKLYTKLIMNIAKEGHYSAKLKLHNDDGFLICDWLKQEGFTISNRKDSKVDNMHYITVEWA